MAAPPSGTYAVPKRNSPTTAMTRLQGRLLLDGSLRSGSLELNEGRIVGIEVNEPTWDEGSLPIIAPGLIDLHIHGFAGCDPLENLGGMGRALAKAGTTSFLPTLFPASPGKLGAQCEGLHAEFESMGPGAAQALGIHLEGPFVNPDAAGALPKNCLASPSLAALREILGSSSAGGRGIRTVTLAPELSGSMDLVEELVRAGVRVSLGHSKAKASEAKRAVLAGASGVTHLYNAMTGIHHRNMGLAGIALTEDVLFAEIIGDLVHVEREAFELALAARGPSGLCLVSDALVGAGTGCDHFHSHGRDHLIQGGAAYYPPDESHPEARLAGSALSQLEMVQRLCREGVLNPAEALTMASHTPARALGVEKDLGSLQLGARADLIVLGGAALDLQQVWVAGVDIQDHPA
jgi:N-acetylglucosamine-6-phosphate deacetylase